MEWAEASGIHVVGDLEDLLPQPPAEQVGHGRTRTSHPRRELLDAALEALAVMTEEAAR